jgi:hypothetical protein
VRNLDAATAASPTGAAEPELATAIMKPCAMSSSLHSRR